MACLLSDELRAELGGAGGEEALLVTASRKKKRGRDAGGGAGGAALPPPPADVVEKHLYRSSKEKRRLEQITKRKEKELRRDEFLQVLKDNEILPQHRDLLISGKELGQMYTVKNRLKMALKRYKAGLALTAEETELLFPNGERREDLDMDTFPGAGDEEGEEATSDAAAGPNAPTDSSGTLLDMFSICAPSADADVDAKPAKKKKTKRDKEENAALPAEAARAPIGEEPAARVPAQEAAVKPMSKAAVVSSGLSLAAQLQQLKSTLKAAAPVASALPEEPQVTSSMARVEDEAGAQRPYEPQPLVMPHAYDHPLAAPGVALRPASSAPSMNSSYVAISRPAEVQESRMNLPVCGMEQELVESIHQNDVVVVCGETGSGKSTQVPQFCYENGYARDGMMIGITQPRRVAAVTTADRVGYEMGDASRPAALRLVGHQIRHENNTCGATAIKFMTDGILLQEMEQDLLLRRYSVIVIDEAHERGINSDVLLGMLSRAVPLRRKQFEQETVLYGRLGPDDRAQYLPPLPPLKLVIMSATLRVEDFASPRLFPSGAPPIVRVEARQYPVTVHFSRKTETSHRAGAYLDECVKKVRQIHTRLPEGGILVFLTGKREITHVVNRLRRALCRGGAGASGAAGEDVPAPAADADGDNAQGEGEWGFGEEGENDDDDDDGSLDGSLGGDEEADGGGDDDLDIDPVGGATSSHTVVPDAPAPAPGPVTASVSEEPSSVELSLRERMLKAVVGTPAATEPVPGVDSAVGAADSSQAPTTLPKLVRVVPLYAMLSAAQQREAFRPVDASRERLIVVATNVAETSITIPNIRYVVDSGREKRLTLMSAGPEQGRSKVVSRYSVEWVSQASADQRKGRAGRTGPGHCYRLYSATFFDAHMSLFSEPQIRTVPLESLVLKMKAIGIRDILGFPFPTPPPAPALRQAVLSLQNIGAITTNTASRPKDSASERERQREHEQQEQLTALGRKLGKLALPPRLAKVLVVAAGHCRAAATAASAAAQSGDKQKMRQANTDFVAARELAEHALGLASILTEKNPFLRLGGRLDENDDGEAGQDDGQDEGGGKGSNGKQRLLLWVHREGDALARYKAFGAYCFFRSKDTGGGGGGGEGVGEGKAGRGRGRGALAMSAETAREVAAFCAAQSLSEQTLSRAYSLRLQLARQLSHDADLLAGLPAALAELQHTAIEAAAAPPSASVETALLQLLLSASGDQLARRAPLGSVTTGSRRQRLTAYLSSSPEVLEPLYLHPHSSLYCSDPTASLPEYVVFSGLVRNEADTATYMECASVVSPGWAASVLPDCPLLQFGPFLDSPAPFYDRQADAVLGYTLPALGVRKWELAPVQLPLTHPAVTRITAADAAAATAAGAVTGFRPSDLVYRWFARLLLENKVPISSSVSLHDVLCKDAYSEAPSIITSCKPVPKVINLLRALIDKGCTSRARLLELLRDSGGGGGGGSSANKYLQEELAAFITLDRRKDFRGRWAKL